MDEYNDFAKNEEEAVSLKTPKTYKDRINKKKLKFFYISLAFKYFFIKVCYLAISIGVFPLIDILLGFQTLRYIQFGPKTTKKIFGLYQHNQTYADYVTAQYFPRQVLCQLEMRADVKQIHTYVFQCGLPANIFNEIVFLALWFWLVLIVLVNALSLVKWTYRFMIRRCMIKEIITWPYHYNYHIGILKKRKRTKF